MPDEPYPIPQSPALQQVSRTSLQELFSCDPETLSRQDIEMIVLQMQDLRERLAAATEKAPRQARARATTQVAIPKIVNNPEDLGY